MHELLLLVLQYLGYVHQQRLVRVCQLWMRTISKELHYIYLDAESVFQKSVLLEWSRSGIPDSKSSDLIAYDRIHRETERSVTRAFDDPTLTAGHPWKYSRPAVRQLIFNGQYVAPFSQASRCVVDMANTHISYLTIIKMFPKLVQIDLIHVVMDLTDAGSPMNRANWKLRDFFSLRSTPLMTMKDTVISAFPTYPTYRDFAEGTALRLEALEALGGYQNSFIRIPDVSWRDDEEFSAFHDTILPHIAIAWPYPDSQTEWLARWAPSLNGHPLLLAHLRVFVLDPATFIFWRIPRMIMCTQHKQFCQHLDVSTYTRLDGQARILLAVYVLNLNIPGMEPPPVPFRFEKLREGKVARFGPVV